MSRPRLWPGCIREIVRQRFIHVIDPERHRTGSPMVGSRSAANETSNCHADANMNSSDDTHRDSSEADEIAVRAFELWEAAGSPPGRDLDFWFVAERERRAKRETEKPAWHGTGELHTEEG